MLRARSSWSSPTTGRARPSQSTDADQIIVAEAGPHQRGELPDITYVAGGLERANIRKAVCICSDRIFQSGPRDL